MRAASSLVNREKEEILAKFVLHSIILNINIQFKEIYAFDFFVFNFPRYLLEYQIDLKLMFMSFIKLISCVNSLKITFGISQYHFTSVTCNTLHILLTS